MRRKSIYLRAILSLVLVLPLVVSATPRSSFEIEQETASRVGMDFTGLYSEAGTIDGDGTAWIGGMFSNGMYYFSEANNEWVGLEDGYDVGQVIDVASSDDYVYMIAGINLYRTTGAGDAWETLSPENVGQVMYYDPTGDDLYVLSRGSDTEGAVDIEISTDDGGTFSTVTFTGSESIQDIAANDGTVYVLSFDSSENALLYKSEDNGATWTDTGNSWSNSTRARVAVNPTDANYVVVKIGEDAYYSEDGGTNFTAFDGTSVSGSILVIDISGTTRVYNGVQYTEDNGVNWTPIDNDSSVQLGGDIIAVDPNDDTRILMDTETAAAITKDSGNTWSEVKDGLYGVTIYSIAQSEDKETVILGAYGGIAKTENFTDAEPTWTYPIQLSGSLSSVNSVYLDTSIALAGSELGLFYSTDNASTWTDTLANVATVNSIIKSDSTYYAGYGSEAGGVADGGVVSSTDGITWTDMSGASGIPVNSLTVDSSGNIYAGIGTESDSTPTKRGIYKYNGSSWTQLSGDMDGHLVNDIMIIDDVIFAASGATEEGGIFRSTDAGASWESLDVSDMGWYHALTYDPDNTNDLYVSTARPAGTGYIYKSTDGGDNWSLYYTGLIDEAFNALHYSGSEIIMGSTDRQAQASKSYTGLTCGSSTSYYKFYSNTNWKTKKNKKKVKKNKKVRLTFILKDAATGKKLKNKKIKLYKKTKNEKWKKLKMKKTNSKGKAIFKNIKIKKNTQFKGKWKPINAVQKREYGTSTHVSSKVTVKLKK